MLPLFEKGARDALNNLLTNQSLEAAANQNLTDDFQVILQGAHAPQSLRSLTAEHINKLIKVHKKQKKHFHEFHLASE